MYLYMYIQCTVMAFLRLFFVQDVDSATSVHASLQGTVLSTSDRGGLRIQYPYIVVLVLHDSVHAILFCFEFSQK